MFFGFIKSIQLDCFAKKMFCAAMDQKVLLATKLLLLGQYNTHLLFNQNMIFHQTFLSFVHQAFCSALAAPPQCRGTTTMSWTWQNGRCHRLTSSPFYKNGLRRILYSLLLNLYKKRLFENSSNCAGITLSTCLALSVETLEVKVGPMSFTLAWKCAWSHTSS